jgi:hypothetical protein
MSNTPRPLSLLIPDNTSNDGNDDDTSDDDGVSYDNDASDDEDTSDDKEHEDHKDQEDAMGKTVAATKKNHATATKKAGPKTMGEDVINLDPPQARSSVRPTGQPPTR